MISELTMSAGPLRSGFFSRFERMTSTRSLGRIKPPAPVSGEISVETARMPAGRIAAMKPEPLALTSVGWRIGSPAMNGARAIEPAISLVASGRSLGRIKLLLAVAAGQVWHCRASAVSVWPRPMSDFATRTSAVCSCAIGSLGGGFLSNPLARYAATPPAPRAIVRTTIRAVFIRFTIHIYAETLELHVVAALSQE